MTEQRARKTSEFDAYAGNYHSALNQGLSLSGENAEYFARGRVSRLSRRLSELQVTPRTVLDFGCGTGATVPLLLELDGVEHVIATDESTGLLERGQQEHGSDRASFQPLSVEVRSCVDVAYCSGVFHHIEPSARPRFARFLVDALRPGGVIAFWENNPWNPGTRLVMRRIPFDRDAVPLNPPTARRLLTSVGAEIVTTDYAFFFPAILGWLRGLESHLRRVPLGAQYLVLARKRC